MPPRSPPPRKGGRLYGRRPEPTSIPDGASVRTKRSIRKAMPKLSFSRPVTEQQDEHADALRVMVELRSLTCGALRGARSCGSRMRRRSTATDSHQTTGGPVRQRRAVTRVREQAVASFRQGALGRTGLMIAHLQCGRHGLFLDSRATIPQPLLGDRKAHIRGAVGRPRGLWLRRRSARRRIACYPRW